MKKVMLVSGLIALAGSFMSCCKEKEECELVPAKILRYDCDRVIFQMLSPGKFGDSVWTDVQTGNRYNNVFSYYNTCQVSALTNGELDTLYIKVKETYDASILDNCVQCLAVSQNPPKTMVQMTKLSAYACSNAVQPGR